MKLFTSIFLSIFLRAAFAANCELVAPNAGTDGSEFGLIFIPGAQLEGQAYVPLSQEIQDLFPGNLWVGVTQGWFGNLPNPVEINGAINDCLIKAK